MCVCVCLCVCVHILKASMADAYLTVALRGDHFDEVPLAHYSTAALDFESSNDRKKFSEFKLLETTRTSDLPHYTVGATYLRREVMFKKGSSTHKCDIPMQKNLLAVPVCCGRRTYSLSQFVLGRSIKVFCNYPRRHASKREYFSVYHRWCSRRHRVARDAAIPH